MSPFGNDNFLQLGAMFGMAGNGGMLGGMLGGLLGNLFGGGEHHHHHHQQPGEMPANPEQQHMQQDMRNLTGGFGGGMNYEGGMGGFNPMGFGNGLGMEGGLQSGGGWGQFGTGCPFQQSPWSVTNTGSGQDKIDLGNYTLSLNKGSSQWTLTNKQTGAITNVWGDPHVDQSDGHNWGFKGNTTFQLDDGTRITVKTIPYGNGQTVSDELDISKGGQGMVVTGLGQNDGAPLQVATGLNGYGLDAANFGTQEIYEAGTDWQTFAGQTVGDNTGL